MLFRKAIIISIFLIAYPSIVYGDNISVGVSVQISQCSDGVDNDIDGFIDYPNDPDCQSANDNNESTPPPPPRANPSSGNYSFNHTFTRRASVVIRGKSHAYGTVELFADLGNIQAIGRTDANGNFEINLDNIGPGKKTFGIWSEDKQANRSIPESFTVDINANVSTIIDGVLLAPTIALDKREVKYGDDAKVFGYSVPFSRIELTIEDNFELEEKIEIFTDKEGFWSHDINSNKLKLGKKSVFAKIFKDDKEGFQSAKIEFLIGNKNKFIPFKPGVGYAGKGDLNQDRRVNLIDLSILLHWYKKDSPPEEIDFYKDNIIDLKDLSIMSYYWTG